MVLSATHRHSSGSVCQLIRFGWGNWNYPAFYQGRWHCIWITILTNGVIHVYVFTLLLGAGIVFSMLAENESCLICFGSQN